MSSYDHFVIPFTVGVLVLFATVIYKYSKWIVQLPHEDKVLIRRGIFSVATLRAMWEVIWESLLHRKIFRRNPLLGYMHASLAFGWFLLIVVGWIETLVVLGGEMVPMHVHVFFKYFSRTMDHTSSTAVYFAFVMDLLLLFVLSGVALAYSKRVYSRMMGLRRTTKHVVGDRVALSALWLIFPARLVAESVTAGLYHNGSFLTGGVGNWLVNVLGVNTISTIEPYAWWGYSVVLGLFFVSMPFSRYMHIFTEIPLIFLRQYKITSHEKSTSFDKFQLSACSRCGICIDPCQLQSDTDVCNIQAVYFLRDRRYGKLSTEVVNNCLMCGRCEVACPVGLDLNTLRLNSREKNLNTIADGRYQYVKGKDLSEGSGSVGYFAGCMTLLTPRILKSMEQIFEASGDSVWWADKNGGVCCGRPLKLSGEIDAATNMMSYNADLFRKHNITTLVTSCPICLKVFREDYDLTGIEVLHHSQYIDRLVLSGKLKLNSSPTTYTYHDPCELGRGCGIYDAPRDVVRRVGGLVELSENRENGLCCGSSIANTAIGDRGQVEIGRAMGERFANTGAEAIVTSCPLCKKAIARNAKQPVYDLSEVVAKSIIN